MTRSIFLVAPLAVKDFHLFLDPLPLWQASRWPWLMLPLCLAVAVVYKSIRCKSMRDVPRQAGELTLVIVLSMAAAAVALALAVRGLEQ